MIEFYLLENIDAPRVQPSGITLALLGERVELKCVVKSRPPPKVIFWRDHEGHEPVPLGSNYEMTTDASSDVRIFSLFFFFQFIVDCLLNKESFL